MLISGEDGVRVTQARADLLAALLGPGAEAEMRLDRIAGAELRREPARLLDALKAVGFFPGPRGVLLEDATDGLAPTVAEALGAWSPGDARLVATGTGLTAKGALRKLFEGHKAAVAITLYDDPPTEGEVSDMLREAGLARVEPPAREALSAFGQALPPGEFRGLLERLGLHQMGSDEPLGVAVVQALAPQTAEAEVDDLLVAVTDGRRDRVALLLGRLSAQGVGPVAVTIQAIRHFRALLSVASDPGGVQAGLSGLRPPAVGARREALQRAAAGWRRERIEEGLRTLVELDLELRSGSRVPDRPLLERALMRLAASKGI